MMPSFATSERWKMWGEAQPLVGLTHASPTFFPGGYIDIQFFICPARAVSNVCVKRCPGLKNWGLCKDVSLAGSSHLCSWWAATSNIVLLLCHSPRKWLWEFLGCEHLELPEKYQHGIWYSYHLLSPAQTHRMLPFITAVLGFDISLGAWNWGWLNVSPLITLLLYYSWIKFLYLLSLFSQDGTYSRGLLVLHMNRPLMFESSGSSWGPHLCGV